MADTVFSSGFRFPEGPSFDKEDNLFIVELARLCVTKIAPDGTSTVFATLGGSPTGSAFGPDGALYVCNGGGRWPPNESTDNQPGPADSASLIQRVAADGSFSTLIAEIDGTPINSPNDICFDNHGNFYFTDPVWPDAEGNVYPGTICYSTTDGQAKRAHTGLLYPNGLAVSDDGGTLIVAESLTGKLQAFPILAPGELGAPREYGFLGEGSIPDGMAFDSEGRLLCAGHGTSRFHVFPPGGGEKEEELVFEDAEVSNICFGGPNFSTLHITQSGKGRVVTHEWKTPGMRLFPDR